MENRRKIEPKEIPSHLIPRLLVVFTRQLEILVTTLQCLSLGIKSYGVTIQMKATEQYFPVVLFVMLYKVVLDFESVDEILCCDHLNESY